MNTGSMTAAKLIWQTTDEKYRAAGRKWQGIPGIERTRGGRLIAAAGRHREKQGSGSGSAKKMVRS